MPVGEIIGLAVTAALLGGLIGAAFGVLIARRRSEFAAARDRRLRAVARWLAAGRTLSRSSWSLVVAFRALAAERRESPYFSLHEQEAQRARTCWSDAMREFDLAEADMAVFGDERAAPLIRIEHVGWDAIRVATSGEAGQLQELRENLRLADERTSRAAAAVVSSETRPTVLRAVASRIVVAIGRVTEHWSRG